MSLRTVAVLSIIWLLAAAAVHADCQGCCSHHGGVDCIGGKTKCEDGTNLSAKCRAKGCQVCEYSEEKAQVPAPGKPTALSSVGEYNREDWPHWIDADGDCQDTRAEILIRDNVGALKFKRNKPCNVSWGRWICPYTGKELTKASDLDIDHIIPLAHAHVTGGASWPREKKRTFANDSMNLLVVDDATNQEKGEKGPDEWKPPRRDYWPEYAKKWRAVKEKHGLFISDSEEKALREMAAYKNLLLEIEKITNTLPQ